MSIKHKKRKGVAFFQFNEEVEIILLVSRGRHSFRVFCEVVVHMDEPTDGDANRTDAIGYRESVIRSETWVDSDGNTYDPRGEWTLIERERTVVRKRAELLVEARIVAGNAGYVTERTVERWRRGESPRSR